MKIKPLIQLREMISKALSDQTNLSKTFQSFFIETMELILTHTGRLNFTQMARCGRSCESRFRQNFRKSFDWLSFNRSFLESTKGHRIAIAIDPCYISKSGKKTPGIDWFWSGCAAAMKKGLEILGISIVDADAKDSVFLKAEQTFTDKKRGRKPDCTKGMKDPDSLTGWYLRMLNRNCKQLLSICKLIVADAYFSKESFVSGVKSLGFNLISRFRDDVNLKYLYSGPKTGKRGRPQKFRKTHHGVWENAHQNDCFLAFTRLCVNHPQRISSKVKLHLAGRSIDIVKFQVVLLLILLKYGFELRVTIRIVRRFAISVLIQNLIGHVFARHGLCIVLYVCPQELIAIGVTIAMNILLA